MTYTTTFFYTYSIIAYYTMTFVYFYNILYTFYSVLYYDFLWHFCDILYNDFFLYFLTYYTINFVHHFFLMTFSITYLWHTLQKNFPFISELLNVYNILVFHFLIHVIMKKRKCAVFEVPTIVVPNIYHCINTALLYSELSSPPLGSFILNAHTM